MSKDTIANFGIGICVGLLIGAVVGILYAPKPGKEIRKVLRDKVGKFAGDVRAKLNRATLADIKGH